MTEPVELRLAENKGTFQIVVQNLAYHKQVSLWADFNGKWEAIDAHYVEQLSNNLELWAVQADGSKGNFVVRYIVNGATYWDNNQGRNYTVVPVHGHFNAVTGDAYPVVLGSVTLSDNTLRVHVAVQNIAPDKVVGIVYKTNECATFQKVCGVHDWTMHSGIEVWCIEAAVEAESIGARVEVEFAIFYEVSERAYWDNNFGRNYKVSAITDHSHKHPIVKTATVLTLVAHKPCWSLPEGMRTSSSGGSTGPRRVAGQASA